jgi:hypothetical protein
MARPQGMTCCQQLAALQGVAELVGALLIEVPRCVFPATTTRVSRKRLAELEDAMIEAGYDMPAVRKRYKEIKRRAANAAA